MTNKYVVGKWKRANNTEWIDESSIYQCKQKCNGHYCFSYLFLVFNSSKY